MINDKIHWTQKTAINHTFHNKNISMYTYIFDLKTFQNKNIYIFDLKTTFRLGQSHEVVIMTLRAKKEEP